MKYPLTASTQAVSLGFARPPLQGWDIVGNDQPTFRTPSDFSTP